MACSDDEWVSMKLNEIEGMVAKLMIRVEHLEKMNNAFIEKIKGSISTLEKLEYRLKNRLEE